MKYLSLLVFSYLAIQSSALGRSPSVPVATDDLWEEICEYKRLESSKPDVDLMVFIALFENMYNTNQISDMKLKKEVFCLLKSFYKQDNPDFAKYFSKEMPNVSCQNA